MKRLIISFLLMFCFLNVSSQTSDSLAIKSSQLLRDSLSNIEMKIQHYEQRLAKRQKFHESLTPDFIRIQYAGSVGLINAGIGWKHNKWETDVMFGYIPRYHTEHRKATFTIRESYVPFTCWLAGNESSGKGVYSFHPLSCGMFINSVLSSDFWAKEPSRYPNGGDYYRFSSKIRFHVFVGQRYTYHIPRHRRFLAKSVSCVWELSTCDLYLISKITNERLPIEDILSLSLGLKFDF